MMGPLLASHSARSILMLCPSSRRTLPFVDAMTASRYDAASSGLLQKKDFMYWKPCSTQPKTTCSPVGSVYGTFAS